MGVTADGWLDWAIRLQPTPAMKNTNAGVNPVNGIFMHSAEGYVGALLDPNSIYGYNGQHSWHLSNLMDGRVFQHYPFTARCHHATAANDRYVGVENEGYQPNEKSLNDAQINNAVRFIRDISAWKGWQPRRPATASDTTHTLWEHNEVVRLGGSGSSCPSGRIPWNEILARLGGGGGDELSAEQKLELGSGRATKYLLDWILRDVDVVPVAEEKRPGSPLGDLLTVEFRAPDGSVHGKATMWMRPDVRRGRP